MSRDLNIPLHPQPKTALPLHCAAVSFPLQLCSPTAVTVSAAGTTATE